ncbi:MAG TPA: 30S ribosomal protein S6 [Melioribacteraceae bacterium]|nr:30S ribosomal protein S6 [Melioribacteraceae bacterium]
MKVKNYESVIILNATLEDEQIEVSLNKILDSIKSYGGEIKDLDKWGRKRLAYPIEKAKSGYYIVIRFAAPTEAIARIERVFRLDETVIRFLTVELTKEAIEYFETQKGKAAELAANTEENSKSNDAVSNEGQK